LEGIVEEITEYLKRMVGYKYALEEDSQYLTSFIPYITNGSLSAMEEYATSRRLLTQLYLDCQNNKLNSLEANFAICYIIGHIKNTISILLNKVDIDHCFDEIIALKNRNKNNQNKNVEDVYISYVL
jgi:hypothetical protein